LGVDRRPEAWKYNWYSPTDSLRAVKNRFLGDKKVLDGF